ncbi:DNA topoisomerase-1 [Gillisia mitskevichiae]|uniref:DNA topoisomerase n=1 Tax=Gillisia mitskevichiae TaxID=270921 RepID=A0A495PL89_9FLAO|nr:DNA topoisomerase IB [Gillisia mitskevichiae]RKS50465.1 DNA topoisomerase-1 [Gillisia mitskevichiae]
MTLTSEEIDDLINDPAQAASIANLIYISEANLSVERKKRGRGYIFNRNGKKVLAGRELDRYKSLVIPPAWRNVRISHLPNGHLQVVGLDEKSRKQYMYHPTWSELRNKTKFFKMITFGKSLPKIRKAVDEDLDIPQMNERKILALVVRLMEETHIRVGNEYYAKNNKTYGLSTLRTRHVKTSKSKMKFEFIGKKGKEHSITITNKKLIKLVNQCEEIPGWELFKFYDEFGEKQIVDSAMINNYIQEISGESFTAKDFRTWAASKIFFETLNEIGYEEDEKANSKAILEAIDAAAHGLGNTRSVCRSYYVHPFITENYENGQIVSYFNKIKEEEFSNSSSLSSSEKIMLDMISAYEVELN